MEATKARAASRRFAATRRNDNSLRAKSLLSEIAADARARAQANKAGNHGTCLMDPHTVRLCTFVSMCLGLFPTRLREQEHPQ